MTSLPVLSDVESLAGALNRLLPGRVRFDRHHQLLYATDASNYQVEPLGVVFPGDAEEMRRLLMFCNERSAPVLLRGGGTSLAGQCTNRAVVVDYSPACRRVMGLDVEGRVCHVEPGITVDELNRWLEGQGCGLFFAPDPATAAQAAIGGCIGNNAAGARSIRYGRTSENIAGLDVVLPSGQRMWLERGAGRRDAAAWGLAERVASVVLSYGQQIRERFPKTVRRNAGYGLDLILGQLERGVSLEDLDLTGLICGSEGTLGVVVGAKVKLHPVARFKGLAIASFVSVEEAIDAVGGILTTGCSAVELLDDVVLTAARGNTECRRYMDLLPAVEGGAARAVLYVEYQETGSMEEVRGRFAELGRVLGRAPTATYVDQQALLRAWALRKAGEPLLHGLAGHRKPVTVIEDNAIPVENLSRFVAGVKKIVGRHGTMAAYWAHASVGVLHIRPMLDLHEAADRERMRDIAVEVADLARECGGVMSGEHGDGRARGPLLERYYGAEVMEAFGRIKGIFDPKGILNPGNIVEAGPVGGIVENLRVRPGERDLRWPATGTYFDYSDQEGFRGAVERCNGAGVCRKTAGGTMCPSYRATLDERHSTRGRGNALRTAISGQIPLGGGGGPAWDDVGTMETLSLCLSCKACKSECPSNVDVARLKAEYTAQRYKEGGIPLAARVFGQVRRLNQIGAMMPGVANWVANLPMVRAIANSVLGLDARRSLPTFEKSLYRWFAGREGRKADADKNVRGRQECLPHQGPRVVLFADCFTTYNEPGIGQAAVELLELLGYRVELPRVGCCGRSMISMGLLEEAIGAGDGVLGQLRPYIEDEGVKAIVVCEPSCLSAMKDDWLQLKLKTEMGLRRRLAEKAMMVEEFVERFWGEHPVAPRMGGEWAGREVILHGHCHQKALWGEESSAALIRRLVGNRLTVLPSGCCGMAGAFGFTKDRYEVSMKIGEQSLLGAVRGAAAEAIVLAPGTSCRHQIKDGTGRRAMHPIELAARLLGGRG